MNQIQETYQKFLDIYERTRNFEKTKIPLCAAETFVSDFVKKVLSTEFEGRYCMNNLNYNEDNDFIGSKPINDLFRLLEYECNKLFGAKYADARTLSGMNCVSIVIGTLLRHGDKVLLTGQNQGGHPSVSLLLDLSGVSYDEIPYDYEKNDINYDALNQLLATNQYSALIFAQSDLLQPADVSKIKANGELIIYDATQTFGMIATKLHKNPLDYYQNLVLIGGTHKTLPGPTSGLILTNNDKYICLLDNKISPSYLRNVQPNHIAGVFLALLEQEQFGKIYQTNIIDNCNYLGAKLEEKGLNIGKIGDDKYSNTHQIFIYTSLNDMEKIFKNAKKYGITLNKKEKRLFHNYGIRLGLQEVTRYGWTHDDLDILADIIYNLTCEEIDEDYMRKQINYLITKKTDKFVFNDMLTK